MRILRLRSGLGQEALRKALDGLDAAAIRVGMAESVEEFELAAHLAKSAFLKKTNIARSMRMEFLLWLSGKTDIRSAVKATEPEGGAGEFIVAIFSNVDVDAACRRLGARKLPNDLKERGGPLALERISLSRAGKQ